MIWVRIFTCMWKGFIYLKKILWNPTEGSSVMLGQNLHPNNNQNLFEHLSLNLWWRTFAQLSYWSCPTFLKKGKNRDRVCWTVNVLHLQASDGVTGGRAEVRRAADEHRSLHRYMNTCSRNLRDSHQMGGPVAPNVPSDLSSVWTGNSTEARFEAALLLDALEKLHKHPVITFTASKLSLLLFQAFRRPSSGGTRRVERGSDSRAKICSFPEKPPVHSSPSSLPCSSSAGL